MYVNSLKALMRLEMAELTGNYVLPIVILKNNNATTKECRMCGKDVLYKKQYYYTSPLSGTKLTVCKNCGIREYYGTKGKYTKKYKRHMSNHKIFGIKHNE